MNVNTLNTFIRIIVMAVLSLLAIAHQGSELEAQTPLTDSDPPSRASASHPIKSRLPIESRLPVESPTRSFWIDDPGANPLSDAGSTGDEITPGADVCIIGAGITGVSAAYHLSKLESEKATQAKLNMKEPLNRKEPLSVVVFEARDFCSGATGRNGGHLTPAVFLDFAAQESLYGTTEALKAFALENYTSTAIVRILSEAGLRDAVDHVDGGHTVLLFTPEEERSIRRDYEVAVRAGMDLQSDSSGVRWVGKEEMEKIYGTPFPAVQFPAHNLWPLKLVTQLYNLAKSNEGFTLSLHTRTPVTSISPISPSTHNLHTSNHRYTLSTPRGNTSCSYVIHATNAYASHLLPHLSLPGPSEIVPTRGQIIALRANTTLDVLGRTSWRANWGWEYWFPRPVVDSTKDYPLVILGGGKEVSGPERYEIDDGVLNGEIGQVQRAFLPELFEGSGKFVEGREPEWEWSGIMGYTPSGHPLVGPVVVGDVKLDGQYIAAGYSGHGMPRAFACAEVVAQMIAAEIAGDEWTKPEWMPEHFLTTAGLSLRGDI